MRTREIVFLAMGLSSGAAVLAGLGELDAQFGTNGLVQIDIALDGDVASAIYAQDDGRLLVGRNNYNRDDDFSILRLKENGTPDLAFGNSGRTSLDVPGVHSTTYAVLQQSDRNIVAGGTFTLDHASVSSSESLALARFLADGTVDTTFGSSGVVRIDFSGESSASARVKSIVQQSDGKLVAAGSVAYMGWWDYGDFGGHDMMLVRIDAAGRVDSGFGKNGRVLLDPTEVGSSEIRWLTQQVDGSLVAAGSVGSDMAVVRLTREGVLDTSFGSAGFVVVAPEGPAGAMSIANAVALQADGKILVGGTFQSGCDREDPACKEFFEAIVARLNPDGSLDLGFGVGGIVALDVPGTHTDIAAGGLLIEPSGTILVAGGTESDNDSRYGFVARLAPNGALDADFGTVGVTLIDLGSETYRSNGGVIGFARYPNGNVSTSLSTNDSNGGPPIMVVARLAVGGNNPGRIGLAYTNFVVDERRNANFIVRRTGGSAGEVRVDYATRLQADSASPASAADFTMSSGTLTWLDGEAAEKAVTIPIAADAVVEPGEHFTLELSNPAGGALLAARQADVAIRDVNDNAGILQFEHVTRSVHEGDISTQLLVTRTGGSMGAVRVSVFSYGLTAVKHEDYFLPGGPLTWANGETGTKGIQISTVVDGPKEADESFRVLLKSPTGGAALGATSTMDVTIIDGPGPPVINPGFSITTSTDVVSGGANISNNSSGGGVSGVLESLLLLVLLTARLWAGQENASRPIRFAMERQIGIA
jgi:uncharacterized delta-60 repeat protein